MSPNDRTINHDWYNQPLPSPVRYRLARSGTTLRFEVSAIIDRSVPLLGRADERLEGLWEGEVAELFLATGDKSEYVEVNLGPSGAWWVQAFSDYRVRAAADTKTHPLVTSRCSDTDWTATLELPLDRLPIDLQAGLLINVCFILGNNPRRYISGSGGIANIAPDFHRRDLLRPL